MRTLGEACPDAIETECGATHDVGVLAAEARAGVVGAHNQLAFALVSYDTRFMYYCFTDSVGNDDLDCYVRVRDHFVVFKFDYIFIILAFQITFHVYSITTWKLYLVILPNLEFVGCIYLHLHLYLSLPYPFSISGAEGRRLPRQASRAGGAGRSVGESRVRIKSGALPAVRSSRCWHARVDPPELRLLNRRAARKSCGGRL